MRCPLQSRVRPGSAWSTLQALECASPPPASLQGFGAVTRGGAGGEICRVTNTDDSGAGSLRACLTDRNQQNGNFLPRTVVFDIGGTITLQSDIRIATSYMTVDGSTAPSPGITIKKTNIEDGEVRLTTSATNSAHDLIFTHLRFDGGWDGTEGTQSNNSATIVLDGEDWPGGIYNIVLDHMVFVRATDSAGDMWGEVKDITVSWSLFYDSLHPMTISHSGAVQARHRISLHHNVFAYNHQRNPQIRGNVRDLDYVNNIVYEWGRFPGGYGIRLRERNGVWPTNINIINNYFYATTQLDRAIIYGEQPGGTTYPGGIYSAGNRLSTDNVDGYSTLDTAVPIHVHCGRTCIVSAPRCWCEIPERRGKCTAQGD